MVGLFVRLKLRLMAGAFRGDTGRTVGFVVGLVLTVCIGLGVGAGLVVLHGHPEQAGTLTAVLYTLLVLGWAVVPLLTFGTDDTLDPSRLALLPLSRRDLIPGLFAAAALGVPALGTVLVLLGSVGALATGVGAALAALAGAALEFAMCLALSRALATALSGLLRSRRGRDLAVMVGLLVALAAQTVNLGSQYVFRHGGGHALAGAGGVLRWLPPGMAAHAAIDARRGAYAVAIGELLLVAAIVVLLMFWWGSSLARALVATDASTQRRVGGGAGRGPARRRRLVPGGRVGAVTLRTLRYSWRDPRRKAGWVAAIVFGGAAPVVALFGDTGPSQYLAYAVCFTALVIATQTLNQFGIDGTANWMNFAVTASAADAREDIAGANLAVAVIGVPALAVIAAVIGAVSSAGLHAVAAFGIAVGVLGAGLGIGSVVSVLAPYPVPDRGTNAFSGAGTGRGCLAGLVAIASMIGTLLAAAPLGVAAAALSLGWPDGRWLLLVAGPAYGVLVCWLGRRLAAGLLVNRMPELLARVTLERAG